MNQPTTSASPGTRFPTDYFGHETAAMKSAVQADGMLVTFALGNAALWFHADARVLGSSYRIFDLAGIIAIAGMSIMLIGSTIVNTVKLYRAEPIE